MGSRAAVRTSRPWVVAVASGAAGVVLGVTFGLLLGYSLDDGDPGATKGAIAAAEPTAGLTALRGDDVLPERCLDAIEVTHEGLVLLDQARSSVRDLEPRRLDAALDAAERLHGHLEDAVEDCRADR